MYCPGCGKELSDRDEFCPECGKKVGSKSSGSSTPSYAQQPKEPSRFVPFILGLLLGLIGVIIAVLVYNGNDGPYTKNPTTTALVWSLFGILFWFIIGGLLILFFVVLGTSADTSTDLINLFF